MLSPELALHKGCAPKDVPDHINRPQAAIKNVAIKRMRTSWGWPTDGKAEGSLSRSEGQICLTALGAADVAFIPVEANTKGVNSLIDTLKFVSEQTNLAAFTGTILGVIPFRDRWVGNTQTVDSRENIAAMAELFPDLTIFPSIKESEQFKKGIRQGKTLTELGYGELEYPFTKIMEILS